jgi:hypothetical protein
MTRSLAALALLLGTTALADCVQEGVAVWPTTGSVVPTNARFVLEGVGPDQATVSALVNGELVLRTEGDAVGVKVQRGWKSPIGRTAVVLKPTRPLKPGHIYTLELAGRFSHLRWESGAIGGNPSWLVGPGGDPDAPKWQSTPEIAEGEYMVHRGHVSRRVNLHLELDEISPSYLIVSLKPQRGSAGAQVYFAPVNGGEVRLGDDGCTGSFAFEDGGAYQGTAKAVDAAGNTSDEVSFALEAPRPTR